MFYGRSGGTCLLVFLFFGVPEEQVEQEDDDKWVCPSLGRPMEDLAFHFQEAVEVLNGASPWLQWVWRPNCQTLLKKQDSPAIQPPFYSKKYVQTSTDRTSRSSHSHVAPVPPRYPTSAVSRMAARSISWNLVATKGLSGYSICLMLGGNWLVVLSLFMNVSYTYVYIDVVYHVLSLPSWA